MGLRWWQATKQRQSCGLLSTMLCTMLPQYSSSMRLMQLAHQGQLCMRICACLCHDMMLSHQLVVFISAQATFGCPQCVAPLQRCREDTQSEHERQSTARLLALIDEIGSDASPVALVAATCRPAALDAALRRPGRLTVEIGFGALPTAERLAVLRSLTRAMPLGPDVDLQQLASQTRCACASVSLLST